MKEQETINRFRGARSHPDRAVLEGFHPLKHALRFDADVLEVLSPDPAHVGELAEAYAPDIRSDLEARLRKIPRGLYERLSPCPPDSGVIARAVRPDVPVEPLLEGPGARPVVFLEAPADLGNLGACVRVAAAAEAGGVITTGPHDPWHATALRGSTGLHYAIPVGRVDRFPECERTVVAFDPGGAAVDPEFLDGSEVLVFGSERQGVQEGTLGKADLCVRLPMRHGVSSLNLATAVAAVLYGYCRRPS